MSGEKKEDKELFSIDIEKFFAADGPISDYLTPRQQGADFEIKGELLGSLLQELMALENSSFKERFDQFIQQHNNINYNSSVNSISEQEVKVVRDFCADLNLSNTLTAFAPAPPKTAKSKLPAKPPIQKDITKTLYNYIVYAARCYKAISSGLDQKEIITTDKQQTAEFKKKVFIDLFTKQIEFNNKSTSNQIAKATTHVTNILASAEDRSLINLKKFTGENLGVAKIQLMALAAKHGKKEMPFVTYNGAVLFSLTPAQKKIIASIDEKLAKGEEITESIALGVGEGKTFLSEVIAKIYGDATHGCYISRTETDKNKHGLIYISGREDKAPLGCSLPQIGKKLPFCTPEAISNMRKEPAKIASLSLSDVSTFNLEELTKKVLAIKAKLAGAKNKIVVFDEFPHISYELRKYIRRILPPNEYKLLFISATPNVTLMNIKDPTKNEKDTRLADTTYMPHAIEIDGSTDIKEYTKNYFGKLPLIVKQNSEYYIIGCPKDEQSSDSAKIKFTKLTSAQDSGLINILATAKFGKKHFSTIDSSELKTQLQQKQYHIPLSEAQSLLRNRDVFSKQFNQQHIQINPVTKEENIISSLNNDISSFANASSSKGNIQLIMPDISPTEQSLLLDKIKNQATSWGVDIIIYETYSAKGEKTTHYYDVRVDAELTEVPKEDPWNKKRALMLYSSANAIGGDYDFFSKNVGLQIIHTNSMPSITELQQWTARYRKDYPMNELRQECQVIIRSNVASVVELQDVIIKKEKEHELLDAVNSLRNDITAQLGTAQFTDKEQIALKTAYEEVMTLEEKKQRLQDQLLEYNKEIIEITEKETAKESLYSLQQQKKEQAQEVLQATQNELESLNSKVSTAELTITEAEQQYQASIKLLDIAKSALNPGSADAIKRSNQVEEQQQLLQECKKKLAHNQSILKTTNIKLTTDIRQTEPKIKSISEKIAILTENTEDVAFQLAQSLTERDQLHLRLKSVAATQKTAIKQAIVSVEEKIGLLRDYINSPELLNQLTQEKIRLESLVLECKTKIASDTKRLNLENKDLENQQKEIQASIKALEQSAQGPIIQKEPKAQPGSKVTGKKPKKPGPATEQEKQAKEEAQAAVAKAKKDVDDAKKRLGEAKETHRAALSLAAMKREECRVAQAELDVAEIYAEETSHQQHMKIIQDRQSVLQERLSNTKNNIEQIITEIEQATTKAEEEVAKVLKEKEKIIKPLEKAMIDAIRTYKQFSPALANKLKEIISNNSELDATTKILLKAKVNEQLKKPIEDYMTMLGRLSSVRSPTDSSGLNSGGTKITQYDVKLADALASHRKLNKKLTELYAHANELIPDESCKAIFNNSRIAVVKTIAQQVNKITNKSYDVTEKDFGKNQEIRFSQLQTLCNARDAIDEIMQMQNDSFANSREVESNEQDLETAKIELQPHKDKLDQQIQKLFQDTRKYFEKESEPYVYGVDKITDTVTIAIERILALHNYTSFGKNFSDFKKEYETCLAAQNSVDPTGIQKVFDYCIAKSQDSYLGYQEIHEISNKIAAAISEARKANKQILSAADVDAVLEQHLLDRGEADPKGKLSSVLQAVEQRNAALRGVGQGEQDGRAAVAQAQADEFQALQEAMAKASKKLQDLQTITAQVAAVEPEEEAQRGVLGQAQADEFKALEEAMAKASKELQDLQTITAQIAAVGPEEEAQRGVLGQAQADEFKALEEAMVNASKKLQDLQTITAQVAAVGPEEEAQRGVLGQAQADEFKALEEAMAKASKELQDLQTITAQIAAVGPEEEAQRGVLGQAQADEFKALEEAMVNASKKLQDLQTITAQVAAVGPEEEAQRGVLGQAQADEFKALEEAMVNASKKLQDLQTITAQVAAVGPEEEAQRGVLGQAQADEFKALEEAMVNASKKLQDLQTITAQVAAVGPEEEAQRGVLGQAQADEFKALEEAMAKASKELQDLQTITAQIAAVGPEEEAQRGVLGQAQADEFKALQEAMVNASKELQDLQTITAKIAAVGPEEEAQRGVLGQAQADEFKALEEAMVNASKKLQDLQTITAQVAAVGPEEEAQRGVLGQAQADEFKALEDAMAKASKELQDLQTITAQIAAVGPEEEAQRGVLGQAQADEFKALEEAMVNASKKLQDLQTITAQVAAVGPEEEAQRGVLGQAQAGEFQALEEAMAKASKELQDLQKITAQIAAVGPEEEAQRGVLGQAQADEFKALEEAMVNASKKLQDLQTITAQVAAVGPEEEAQRGVLGQAQADEFKALQEAMVNASKKLQDLQTITAQIAAVGPEEEAQRGVLGQAQADEFKALEEAMVNASKKLQDLQTITAQVAAVGPEEEAQRGVLGQAQAGEFQALEEAMAKASKELQDLQKITAQIAAVGPEEEAQRGVLGQAQADEFKALEEAMVNASKKLQDLQTITAQVAAVGPEEEAQRGVLGQAQADEFKALQEAMVNASKKLQDLQTITAQVAAVGPEEEAQRGVLGQAQAGEFQALQEAMANASKKLQDLHTITGQVAAVEPEEEAQRGVLGQAQADEFQALQEAMANASKKLQDLQTEQADAEEKAEAAREEPALAHHVLQTALQKAKDRSEKAEKIAKQIELLKKPIVETLDKITKASFSGQEGITPELERDLAQVKQLAAMMQDRLSSLEKLPKKIEALGTKTVSAANAAGIDVTQPKIEFKQHKRQAENALKSAKSVAQSIDTLIKVADEAINTQKELSQNEPPPAAVELEGNRDEQASLSNHNSSNAPSYNPQMLQQAKKDLASLGITDTKYLDYLAVKANNPGKKADQKLGDLEKRITKKDRKAKTVEDLYNLVVQKESKTAKKLQDHIKFGKDTAAITNEEMKSLITQGLEKKYNVISTNKLENQQYDEELVVDDDGDGNEDAKIRSINEKIQEIIRIKQNLYNNVKVSSSSSNQDQNILSLTIPSNTQDPNAAAIQCKVVEEVNSSKINMTTEGMEEQDLKNMDDQAIYKMISIMAETCLQKGLTTLTAHGLYDKDKNPILFDKDKTERVVKIIEAVCKAARLKYKIENQPKLSEPAHTQYKGGRK